MRSVVSICSRALQQLGEPAIASLAEDSRAARECALAYAPVRDAVLRDHPWNAALRRASLPALSEPPPWGFAFAFQLPSDCLRVVEVLGCRAWAIEGRQLLADVDPPAALRYVARLEDPTLFDDLLAEAIAARLAVELAEALTQSTSKRELALALYATALRRAKVVDGQEGVPADLPEDPWLEARE